jgi:hypothetical protein
MTQSMPLGFLPVVGEGAGLQDGWTAARCIRSRADDNEGIQSQGQIDGDSGV